jgi:chemotaxis receptor (MCP) glutamine deamidase CheD
VKNNGTEERRSEMQAVNVHDTVGAHCFMLCTRVFHGGLGSCIACCIYDKDSSN